MGSNTSKVNNDGPVTVKNDLEVSGNPDPRSPTPEITRTPLQNKPGTKHNITKNVDLRKTFENVNGDEKLIHNNPILSAVIKNHLQSYDPRSPSQDFERTPIVINTQSEDISNEKQFLRSQLDNCGSPILKTDIEEYSITDAHERSPDLIVSRNLCEGMLNFTIDDSMKESKEPLGSSTASNSALENEISKSAAEKPTCLLETNFDYNETNNDRFEDSEENIQNSIDSTVYTQKFPVFKLLDKDPRSPSIGIDRTPIVVAKTEDDPTDSKVENMSDDTLIKVLQNNNTELRQTVFKNTENKGDGLLIYEDEISNINDTPKKSKSDNVSGSRTPLSCMKNKSDAGHIRSKSTNTLYDPKNQQNSISKIPKRVSHIPRLKCLSQQTKSMYGGSSVSLKNISKTATAGDCENTPPHSHRDRWDKDTSIVL